MIIYAATQNAMKRPVAIEITTDQQAAIMERAKPIRGWFEQNAFIGNYIERFTIGDSSTATLSMQAILRGKGVHKEGTTKTTEDFKIELGLSESTGEGTSVWHPVVQVKDLAELPDVTFRPSFVKSFLYPQPNQQISPLDVLVRDHEGLFVAVLRETITAALEGNEEIKQELLGTDEVSFSEKVFLGTIAGANTEMVEQNPRQFLENVYKLTRARGMRRQTFEGSPSPSRRIEG